MDHQKWKHKNKAKSIYAYFKCFTLVQWWEINEFAGSRDLSTNFNKARMTLLCSKIIIKSMKLLIEYLEKYLHFHLKNMSYMPDVEASDL